MIKLLTSGGLGDAAVSFAKLSSKLCPFDYIKDNIELTHITNIRGRGGFANSILEFYKSQNINSIIQLDNAGGGFYNNNRCLFNHYLGTHWSAHNDDEESWEINPFPPIKYTYIPNVDILFNPFAGWNQGRRINVSAIKDKINKDNFTYIGKVPDDVKMEFDSFAGNNQMNKTTMTDLVNLIASCNSIITQDGFVAFFGAMCGKNVRMFPNPDGLSKERIHPKWDITIIDGLFNEIG